MAELALLRWFRYVVVMGNKIHHKMAWRDRTNWKKPKGGLRLTWEEGIHTILKGQGTECNGVRAIARECERWKAFVHHLHLLVEGV
jgi:hypothetical protein